MSQQTPSTQKPDAQPVAVAQAPPEATVKSSALFTAGRVAPPSPPTARISPDPSSVAVCHWRATVMFPANAKVPEPVGS